jgi:hypothetical protein
MAKPRMLAVGSYLSNIADWMDGINRANVGVARDVDRRAVW